MLNAAASPALPTILENATNPAGITVASLVVDGSITDADGSAVEAIAITALDTSLGTWQYSIDGGINWLTIDGAKINSSTNELALLLGPTASIRMLPFGDLNGTLSTAITFRAWDMSSGSTGDYTVITNPGTGTSAFSAASDTASLTVTAVNDAPTFAPVAGSGKLIVPVGSSDDFGRSVVVQPDGKILMAGYLSNGSDSDYSLIRLSADGSLDTSFDGDGKLILPVGSSLDYGQSVTVQADGKILVAGYSLNSGTYDFSLIRLNSDGSTDSAFGSGGKLVVPVGSSNDVSYSVVVQPDGKILIAGASYNGTDLDFSLIRVNADGSLDTSFDGDGKLVLPIGSSNDVASSLTVQPDGKILVAGTSSGTNSDFSVIRLNADGVLDSAFGTGGKLIVPVGSGEDAAYSLTLQPDGKILVAGYSFNGTDNDFSLIRLTADGWLDGSFGSGGRLLIPLGSGQDETRSLTLQPDGKILVAGFSFNGSDTDFSVVRLNADGLLDTSFDGDGKLIVPVGSGEDSGRSLSLQPDGKILLAGYSSNGINQDFSLIRVNADGSLDTTFNGTATNTLGGSVSFTENAAAVALDAGVAIYDADLAALNNGAGDYGGASITLARNGGANAEDVFSAISNLSFTGGNAVLSGETVGTVSNTAGTLSITFNSNATQARVNELLSSLAYANASGTPPASVQIVWTFSDGNTSAQGSGGALVVQGTSTVSITPVNDSPVLNTAASPALPTILEGATNPAGITVASLVVDGSITDADGTATEAIAITALDTSLGTWQYSTDGGTNWLTIDAAKINSTTNELALLLGPTASIRMLPFGDLNGTLSTAITFRAWDMSSGSTGDYTVITNPGTGTSAFSAASDTASLTVTAVNDAPTFARLPGTGKLIVPVGSSSDFGNSLTVQPDGKILVAGQSFNGSDYDFSLARLNADGSLDTSFDGDGKLIVPVGSNGRNFGNSVTVQPDGKIIVAGSSSNGINDDFSLIRLNADGSLDTSFNGNGKLVISVGSGDDSGRSVTIQPDGKIIVAGTSFNGSNNSFSLIRLNTDGSLDTSFDGDGKLIVPVGVANEVGSSVTAQPDGRILLAGYSSNGSDADFSLIRLNADGSLDTSFNGDGKLIMPVGSGDDIGKSVTVQTDGKILLAGYSSIGIDFEFSLIRLNADGTLDTGFNGSGKLIMPVGSDEDTGQSVSVQTDGKILVAGNSFNGSDYDFSLIRLNADGTLDTTFDNDGKLIVPVGTHDDLGYSLTLQPDGRILVAGSSINGSTSDFSLIRVNADGSLDTAFGSIAANTLGGSVSYTEGAAAVALDAGVAIYDADLAALNNGAGDYSGASITLARDGGANAEDVFSTLGNLSFTGGDAVLSGLTIGTVSNAAGTLSITFNSNATQARVDELLSSLAYANASGTPPASVQIVWTFSDGNTSAQGSGGALTTQGTSTVNITSVNDAPSGTSATLTTTEDTPRVLAAADFGFTDASDSPANALLAVSISTLPNAGSLTVDGIAVTVGQSISVADINAGKLVFTPGLNASGTGYASFTFRVQDNGGTANGGVDLDPTAKTITFNVIAVNDAPSGASATLTTNEGTVWVFAATDFGFGDANDTPANAFSAVTISSLATAGNLTLAGTAVTVGQSISIADINAGRLVFTPVANASGTGYASFTFRVQDNGGTANGGVDLDPTAKMITFNVIAANDAPSGASATLTMAEGTPWVFAATDFGFSDTNDSPSNALMAVTMSSLPTAGNLTLAGTAVTVGQSISVADISAGRLVFTPVTNGTGSASFTFRVQDNGGTSNGGVDLDPTAKTINFNVIAVNDAPSGADKTLTTGEGTPWVFAATDFGFSDTNDSPSNALMAVTMSSLPTVGSLTLAGTAVTVGQSISVADINAGRLVFTPVTNGSGTGYASITFRVQDNGGTANGGVDLDPTAKTITFNVIADNDAPSGASATFTTTEDTPWVFAATDFGFSDTNDSPANALMAVTMSSLPTAGSLTLAGIAVTAGQSISIGDINAGQLVFTPVANGNSTAYASLTFQVQDNGGTANGGVDLDPTAKTITFNVTPVNDAPSGANATFTTTEDAAWVFAATDFGFSDTNDSPSNALMAVTMSSLPTVGSLTLAGTAVTVGQSISIADINAGRLVFTPVTNGTGSASFTFRVQDNGGIANGGVDLDPTAKTITFNLTPVNSAPVITSNGGGASASLSVTENSTSVTQVTATDIDLPAQRLGYSIVGGADAARFLIDTNTGLLSFVSSPRWHLPADANGDNRYQVIVGADDGSLLTTQALAITVTNLPDAPVVTAPPAATLLENTGIPIAGLSVSDVDGNLSTVSLRVEHGSLALDLAGGATIVAGEQGSSTITLGGNSSQLQAALASLSYRSVRDFHGSDTLQVLATDATGLQSGASTAITITPINHLPEVNAPGSQATLAGMPLEFRVEGNNPIFITDTDDIESTLRVTLTVNGGSLSIATVDGLTLAPPLGVGADSKLIIEGPMRAVNAALATLSFLPADDFFGETRLDLIVRDLTDPASGVDLPRSVPIEVSLPPTFARTPGSPIPVSTPPVMSIPVTSTPGATTPATSTSVGTTTVTSSPVGTTPVLTPPVGSSSLPAAGTASATDAASGRESAKPGVSASTSASSREDALAPIVPSLITAPGADRSDIAIRLIAPVEMARSAPTDISAARRLESSMTVPTVVRAFESQALVAGVFVVTPDSVSVIGLADDTRNSIDASPQATEIRLRSESLEPTQTVVDELTLSSLSVQSTAAAVSAGVLWWLVNGGTLLWIVLTYGPLARTFDPLPILARERRDDEDDDGLPDRQDPLDVPTLFDDPNAPSPAHTPVPDNISRQPAAIVESA
ncbi:MAG: Ig-like domain-containing protein [Burkholderiales bacterium]|nr:Ig-like domain-containing protein [Burkholderiales bacterium]